MDENYRVAHLDDNVAVARWLLRSGACSEIYVLDASDRLVGSVRDDGQEWQDGLTLADVLVPAGPETITHPDADIKELEAIFRARPSWQSVAVVENDTILGVVHRGVMARVDARDPTAPNEEGVPASLYPQLLDAMESGIFVVDERGIVRLLNRYGADLLGVDRSTVQGRSYEELAQYIFPHMLDYLRISAVPGAIAAGARAGERQVQVASGREILFKFGALTGSEWRRGVVVTFVDVTALKGAEAESRERASEAERAFGLTLPNSKVESKLRSSVEYQDVFDPKTGRAVVVRIIPDGTYRHVINGLRIMADLKELGVFQLVGIDKDTVVQAFIFHDLGKEQPRLEVGQEFLPTSTFEPGHLHAARSAEWALREYRVSPEAALLVRHHHTEEPNLPDSFPVALKPMYRLIRLVDGLSASVTRRNGLVTLVRLEGSMLEVHEDNRDERYDRRYRISLYTGASLDCEHSRRAP